MNEISDGICGTDLQIMVRTRGLGRVLGHVTSRGVGRRNRDDFDDAPQRRRPTASARRQQVPVTVANDEPVSCPKARPNPRVLTMICKCLPQIPSLISFT